MRCTWTSYLKEQKEKILDFARELESVWEITEETLRDTYFYNFIAK